MRKPVQRTAKISVFEVVPGGKVEVHIFIHLHFHGRAFEGGVGKILSFEARLPVGRGQCRRRHRRVFKQETGARHEGHLSGGELFANAVQRGGRS